MYDLGFVFLGHLNQKSLSLYYMLTLNPSLWQMRIFMSGTKVDFYLRRASLYITMETSIDTNTITCLQYIKHTGGNMVQWWFHTEISLYFYINYGTWIITMVLVKYVEIYVVCWQFLDSFAFTLLPAQDRWNYPVMDLFFISR